MIIGNLVRYYWEELQILYIPRIPRYVKLEFLVRIAIKPNTFPFSNTDICYELESTAL